MHRTLMNVLASALLAAIAISARAQNASAPQASLASAGAQQGTSSAVSPAAAAGAQLAQGARSSESDELANLQKQIPLWKARAEIAKYQAEVRKSEPAVGLAAPLPAATMAAAQGAVPAAAPAASALAAGPRAISLHAYDGKYTAMVEVNGQAIPVRAGDTLDGGWKVAGIDDAGIKIVNGKRVRILRP